ncbi:MAG: GAF domain-containing sensor histidine kinase [Bacteroidota bacterium]
MSGGRMVSSVGLAFLLSCFLDINKAVDPHITRPGNNELFPFHDLLSNIQLNGLSPLGSGANQADNPISMLNIFIIGGILVIALAFVIIRAYRKKRDERKRLNQEVISLRQQLSKQKDQVDNTYETLRFLEELGKEISSKLSAADIIETVYSRLNALMDAEVFGIGILNDNKTKLEFSGAKEKQNTLPDFHYSLDDKERLAVISFLKNKEIVIEDYKAESGQLSSDIPRPLEGNVTSSLVYVPLRTRHNYIGVMTVQSFAKNAYNQRELSIIRNLANYTSIALDKAHTYHRMAEQSSELLVQKEAVQTINANLEAIVQERTSQLQEIYEELNLFLYRSSHDLRRPVSTIMGLHEVAKVTLDDENAQDLFLKVRQTASNMDSLIRKFSVVHEISMVNATFPKTDFNEIKLQILERFGEEVAEAGMDFQMIMNTHRKPKLNPYVMYTIFEHLLDNALKFRRKRSEERPYMHIEISENNTFLIIKAIDNGVGIPAEYQDKIFDMYFVGSELSQGNGLGLYITKKAVEKFNGAISVRSVEKKYTEFEIVIPIKIIQNDSFSNLYHNELLKMKLNNLS